MCDQPGDGIYLPTPPLAHLVVIVLVFCAQFPLMTWLINSTMWDYFNQIPTVSKFWLIGSICVSTLVQVNVLSPLNLYFSFHSAFVNNQVSWCYLIIIHNAHTQISPGELLQRFFTLVISLLTSSFTYSSSLGIQECSRKSNSPRTRLNTFGA